MDYHNLDETALREQLESCTDLAERCHIRAALRRLRLASENDLITKDLPKRSGVQDDISSRTSNSHEDRSSMSNGAKSSSKSSNPSDGRLAFETSNAQEEKTLSIVDTFNSNEERRATFAWRKEHGKNFTKEDGHRAAQETSKNKYENITDEEELLYLLKNANDLDERIKIRTTLWKLREKQGKPVVGKLTFPRNVEEKAAEELKTSTCPSSNHTALSSSSSTSLADLEKQLDKEKDYNIRSQLRRQIAEVKKSHEKDIKSNLSSNQELSDPVKTKNEANKSGGQTGPKYVEIEIKDADHLTEKSQYQTGVGRSSRGSSSSQESSIRRSKSEKELPVSFNRNFQSFSPSLSELRTSRKMSTSKSSDNLLQHSHTCEPKFCEDTVISSKDVTKIEDENDKLNKQLNLLQKQLDSSSEYEQRRKIRAEIRLVKASIKDVKENLPAKPDTSYSHLLRKKQDGSGSVGNNHTPYNSKSSDQTTAVATIRTKNPEETKCAERTMTVEKKRTSAGGTQYNEVNTVTTRLNSTARGSKHYETDYMTNRRINTKSGSEFDELDVTITKDGYSASEDRDYQETTKAQILLTKTLGEAMKRNAMWRCLSPTYESKSAVTEACEVIADCDVSNSGKENTNEDAVSQTSSTIETSPIVSSPEEEFAATEETGSSHREPLTSQRTLVLTKNTSNNNTQRFSVVKGCSLERKDSASSLESFIPNVESKNEESVLPKKNIGPEKKSDSSSEEESLPQSGVSVEKSEYVPSYADKEEENREITEAVKTSLSSETDDKEESEEEESEDSKYDTEDDTEDDAGHDTAEDEADNETEDDTEDETEEDKEDDTDDDAAKDEKSEHKTENASLTTAEDNIGMKQIKSGIDIRNSQEKVEVELLNPPVEEVVEMDVPLDVLVPLNDITVNDGQVTSLSCEIQAPDSAEVLWYRDAQLIPQSLEYTQVRVGNVIQLLIPETLSDDEGEYKCVVTTGTESVSTTAKLTVKAEKIVKGIAPVMKHQLVDKMVIEGDQQVTLKCQVTGTPEPMITWYFGNRKLPNCSEFEQTYNGLTSIAKLVIGEVFVDDEGEYSCIAENCCGRARSSCWIAVEEEADDGTPEFTVELQDVEAVDGDVLTLSCQVSASPKPSISWYRKEKKLQNCEDYKQTYDGKTAIFIMDEVFPEDSDTYKCVAENSKGSATTCCKVTVKETEKTESTPEVPLAFTTSLADMIVIKGDALCLTCQLEGGKNANISWYKNGKLLESVDFSQTFEEGEVKLEIKKVSLNNQGKYRCVATLGERKVNTECKIKVIEPVPDSTVKADVSIGSSSKNSPSVPTGERRLVSSEAAKTPEGQSKWAPGGPDRLKRVWPPAGGSFAANLSKFQSSVKVTDRPSFFKNLTSGITSSSKMSGVNINAINDEDELYKMMEATQDFDERKRIRARMKEVREAKSAEWEKQRAEREAQKVDPVAERQRKAGEAKQRKLQQMAEADKKAKETTKVDVAQQNLRERQEKAQKEKEEQLKKITEMGAEMTRVAFVGGDISRAKEDEMNAKLQEKATTRATKTEKGLDGSMTTTTTTVTTHKTQDGSTTMIKKNKQITQVGGIGGTHYSITKQAAEDAADRIADFLAKSAGQGMSGLVSVKTESWNSRDGNTRRAEKTQAWEARQPPRSAMSAFKQMDANSPNAGGGVAVQRSPSTIKQMLLDWCKNMTAGYQGVNITNFSSSWNDGMAFCALCHHFWPDAFDFNRLDPKRRKANFAIAFDVAEKKGGIAKLLDVEDMVRMRNPDWKCVFTYVQQFYRKYREGLPDDQKSEPSTPTTPGVPAEA